MAEFAELEERLTRIGQGIDWPATPQLGSGVVARITLRVPAARPWFQSRLALAAAAVLLAVPALAAYTPTREGIANWINVHTNIRRVTTLPTPSPRPPGPLGQRLGLGDQTTLDQARAAVGWKVLVPASLSSPDEVYYQGSPLGPPQGEVTLVYTPQAGIQASGQTGVGVLITEARGSVNSDFFGKMLGPGTTLEDVTVGGHKGYWIAGQPNVFFLIDSAGNIRNETLRLATNTLLIDEAGTVVRIEGDLTKAHALQIAASLS